jgi:hypothetical protein
MAKKGKKGIFRKKKAGESDDELRVVDFTYQNDSLAQMIVTAWIDQNFQNQLTGGTLTQAVRSDNAKQALAVRGIYLQKPIVITEQEYNDGYEMEDPNNNEVVFVLPNYARAQPVPAQFLLETAKLLMAYTPHGI